MVDTPQEPAPSNFGQMLLDLADKASTKREDSQATQGSSLLVYLVLTALVVLGFAVMGWLTVRARRKEAQLAYELRQKEEELKRVTEDAKLVEDQKTRDESEVKILDLSSDISKLRQGLAAHEEESLARAQILAKASSWDDLIIVDKRS